jgi:hypothetical protein
MIQPTSFTSLLSSLLVLGLAAGAWGCERTDRQELNNSAHENVQVVTKDASGKVFPETITKSNLEKSNPSSNQDLQLVANNNEITSVKVKAVQLQRQSEDGRCLINIEYPQVEGLANINVQRKINSQLKDLFLQAPTRTLNVQKCTTESSYSRHQEAVFGWTSDYEIGLNRKGFLSINGYTSLTPGAHPLNLAKTITFNLKDGSTYGYSDLFKPGSNYIKQINQLIPKKIYDYLELHIDQTQLDADEIQDIVDHFQPKEEYQFYLNDQGLVLVDVFDNHALQAIRVEIGPSEIHEIVNSDGPLQAIQQN